MLTMIVLMLAAAQPQPVSREGRDQAWVLGYTSFVRHVCPTWDQQIDGIPADILPNSKTWNGAWAENGTLAIAHRGGVKAAEHAQRTDTKFCDHPTRSQPKHAVLLNRALKRRSGGR